MFLQEKVETETSSTKLCSIYYGKMDDESLFRVAGGSKCGASTINAPGLESKLMPGYFMYVNRYGDLLWAQHYQEAGPDKVFYTAGVMSLTLAQPTSQPTGLPSGQPTRQPSGQPSSQPSSQPSTQPTMQPSGQPSSQPTMQPSGQPSSQPTAQPSTQPSRQPSSQPTSQPTGQPSSQPSRQPSSQPSRQPTGQPTSQPSRKSCLALLSVLFPCAHVVCVVVSFVCRSTFQSTYWTAFEPAHQAAYCSAFQAALCSAQRTALFAAHLPAFHDAHRPAFGLAHRTALWTAYIHAHKCSRHLDSWRDHRSGGGCDHRSGVAVRARVLRHLCLSQEQRHRRALFPSVAARQFCCIRALDSYFQDGSTG
jgi:hypothetical protein